jgi:integrase
MSRTKKHWSYLAGERGKNRVRALEAKGKLWLEWKDENDRKRRVLLPTIDRAVAVSKAEEAAQALLRASDVGPEVPTLQQLLNEYLAKRTPLKGGSKKNHDRRAARLFLACFGPGRRPETLNRIDWENFIDARRHGRIPGHPPVGERQIAYDLKFMIAVLNWAMGAGVNGRSYLAANPWSAERRRALGLKMPRPVPKPQPTMTSELHERLIEHAPDWRFRLAMILGRGTISRNGSVRFLKWADIDFERRTIRWRGEYQKDTCSMGEDRCTPLSEDMVRALRAAEVQGIGEAWIFPSPRDPRKACSRHVMQGWLKAAKRRLFDGIEDPEACEAMRVALAGVGFHAQKRYAVRAHRHLPPKVLEALARTKYKTLVEVYDHVDVDEMRAYVEANGDPRMETKQEAQAQPGS